MFGIKDLMIGDYVSVYDKNHVCKIGLINTLAKNDTIMVEYPFDENGDKTPKFESSENIYPLFITEQILFDSGFEKMDYKGHNEEGKDAYYIIGKNNEKFILVNHADGIFRVYYWDWFICSVCCVHDLQHLLKIFVTKQDIIKITTK